MAYGIASSPCTGQGATIAIMLEGALPTMLADANRFFASHGVAVDRHLANVVTGVLQHR
jgi:hypothetical protein